jgi:hypothetical protein
MSLKSSWQKIKLCYKPHLNQRIEVEVTGLQSCKSPNFENFGTPKTEWCLGVDPVAMHKNYYKGEGGGFPQGRVVMSLVNPCLLVVRSWPKMLQLHTNQLVVWFVQAHVNNWLAWHFS